MQLDAVGLCNIWDLSVTSIRFLRLLYVQVENFIPGINYVFIRFVLITLDLVLHLMKLFLYLSQFEGSHHLTRYSDLVSLDSHMQHHKSGIKLTLFTTGQVQRSAIRAIQIEQIVFLRWTFLGITSCVSRLLHKFFTTFWFYSDFLSLIYALCMFCWILLALPPASQDQSFL